jgi:hypothetical protein
MDKQEHLFAPWTPALQTDDTPKRNLLLLAQQNGGKSVLLLQFAY